MSRPAMRIAILTTGRQDWTGLLAVARELDAAPDFDLRLIAGGMHGRRGAVPTVLDGVRVAATLEALPEDDTAWAVAMAAAGTGAALANLLAGDATDALVLLGDRTETLAAAVTSTCMRIPIIHLHGGEETEGAIDNACRHAITKLAHVHFVAHSSFGRRLERMGERPDHVIVSGAPALDIALGAPALSRTELAGRLGLQPGKRWIVCTHHPATLGRSARGEIDAIVATLETMVDEGLQVVITRPNVDEGSSAILQRIDAFARSFPGDVVVVDALGATGFFSLLRESVAMIGNSSSGIIEAPLFRLPVVNVGDRQRGRLRGTNVIDVPASVDALRGALARAMSSEMRTLLEGTTSPYGDGRAARRVVDGLRKLRPSLATRVKSSTDAERR